MTVHPVRITILAVVAFVIAVALVFGLAGACKSYTRYQARADANNDVQVSAIRIRNQEQRVKIAQQSAQIKHEIAVGQRLANQEIASRLTPLFVQYEMIEALKAVAVSGRNNSIVYIPAGANGVPLVSVTGQPQVYGGQSSPQDGK